MPEESDVGKKKQCWKCKTPIECQKDNKGKPSWYNANTYDKHYNFDKKTQEVTCKIPTTEQTTEPTQTKVNLQTGEGMSDTYRESLQKQNEQKPEARELDTDAILIKKNLEMASCNMKEALKMRELAIKICEGEGIEHSEELIARMIEYHLKKEEKNIDNC